MLELTTRQVRWMLLAVLVAAAPPACSDSDTAGSITAAECEAGGGMVTQDACPSGLAPITVTVGADGKCCTVGGSVTTDHCMAMGGQVHADPGDGSLKSCPGGTLTLSTSVTGLFEGGFCCRDMGPNPG